MPMNDTLSIQSPNNHVRLLDEKEKMKKINKRTKKNLIFDEEERKGFLTGFRKRKAERKIKAKEKLQKEMREEKIRLKKEEKETICQFYLNQRGVPEVEHLVEPVTYELPDHLVKITEIDTNKIAGELGFTMGLNKAQVKNDDEDDEQSGEEQVKPGNLVKVKKELKKKRLNVIKKSDAFKKDLKQQKIKSKKQALLKKKLIKKELKKHGKKRKQRKNDK